MSRHHRALAGLLVISLLALAACAGASTGGNGGNGNSNGSHSTAPTATATPKPKPSSVPPVTTAYCQQLMTIAEANQIIQPANPATTIAAGSGDGFGTCHYSPGGGGTLNDALLITLETYKGSTPISQQDITDYLAQTAQDPEVTVTSFQMVTGVGDQAAFAAVSFHPEGFTAYADGFVVLYGGVLFDCATPFVNTAPPPAATQMSKLQQCASQVLSRM